LGTDGEKMSKSRGNVINHDQIVDELGADAFRMYEMFMGAFDQAIPWSTNGARGCRKFLDRVWRLQEIVTEDEGYSDDLKVSMHQTIKKVGDDFEQMKFNTAIAQMMTLVNRMYQKGSVTRTELAVLLQLLNPVAPHITEEMNETLALGQELVRKPWPVCDEKALVKDEVEVALQINGKVRGRVMVPSDLTRENAEEYFKGNEEVIKLLDGKQPKKLIYVPGRLFNIVI
jgi:leucyl-tRNA synthetase